jgi:hypothetical protein
MRADYFVYFFFLFPKDVNPVVLSPEIEEATSFDKKHDGGRILPIVINAEFAAYNGATSYTLAANKDIKFKNSW